MKRCYYEVLGVQRTASIEEIKGAYRKLAKELHPDKNPGDTTSEHRFKEINEAYDVLKDDQKRAAYDRFGHAAFENGMDGGAAAPRLRFRLLLHRRVRRSVRRVHGRAPAARRQNRGGDLRYNLEITLEDAFRGRTVEIRVPSAIACEACGGSGAEAGSKPETCPTCSGIGKVRAQQGFFTIERTCPKCRGNGRVVKNPCRVCHGQGRVQKERTLSVDIPPGVEEGTRIRLSGEGQAGMHGGAAGDLYIFLSVAQHTIFSRDGENLHCRVPIGFALAALGAARSRCPRRTAAAPKVTVPEGAQGGHQIRLKGKGMPVLKGGSVMGDLLSSCASRRRSS